MLPDSLWTRFTELAARIPDVEAVLSPGRRPLFFRDLPFQLQNVREDLARIGIGRGDRVAAVLRRGPETAVCYLGVAASATYVALNPDFSEAELTSRLVQLRPAAVIVPEHHGSTARACASALGIRVIDLVSRTSDPAGTFSLKSRAPLCAPRMGEWNAADDVALVLLTSGSTAKPKAVPLRVRHLLAYAGAAGRHYALGPHDRCLHVMPMFHGHGLKSSLLVPLANGCGVIAAPDVDIPAFFQHMDAMRPTWYSAASSIHQAVLARIDDHREIARRAGLRFIRSGSGRLDPRVMAGLEEAFGAPVLERYGMSETGTLTSNCLPPGARTPGSVGPPMGNDVAIVDERGNFVGPNHEGEVVARGPSVFDGYLDDPDATRAAFLNGWFRTGDLGRFDDDGCLILTGRIKDVINRGGEKIGAMEVEDVLLRHPDVLEACVFSHPHPTLGEDVAAAVSARRTVSQHELQIFARGLLASAKVPRRVFFLPSLPKGPTGKIQRSETAAVCLDLLGNAQSGPDEAPAAWSPLEREVARVWTHLLRTKEIGLNDDFFLLGGDSLQAAALLERVHRTWRVMLHVEQMFGEASTIAGMARLIERARAEGSTAPRATAGLVTIKATGTRPPLFMVPGSPGDPVGFIHLARLVDPRQPVIGIESRGMDGIETPLTRMRDVAADNIARIRSVQPRGPYFLGGMCFGGRVAYEMACQLEAAGERVGLLLMFDASSPFFDRLGRRRGERAEARRNPRRSLLIRYVFDGLRRQTASFVALRGRARRKLVRKTLAAMWTIARTGDIFCGDRREFGRQVAYAANRQAGRDYVPGPFGGPAILVLTRDRPVAGSRNFRLDWLNLVPQIGAPIYVSGRQSGDMQYPPHVYEIADLVNGELEAAHAREESDVTWDAPRAARSDPRGEAASWRDWTGRPDEALARQRAT